MGALPICRASSACSRGWKSRSRSISVDDRPVDLVFLLLTPDAAGADHLKALARVSRLLRDRAVCAKLRGTDRADALYALLTDRTASHAA